MESPAARDSWPASVSPLVQEAVEGEPRAGVVLGVFPTSVYVGLEEHDSVMALLTRDALWMPIGLRLATSSTAVSWGVAAGDLVSVGEGRVRLPRADVVAARVQRPPRVTARRRVARAGGSAGELRRPTGAAHGPADRVDSFWAGGQPLRALAVVDGELAEAARELAAAALAGGPVAGMLRGLVGSGVGLTPSGDDAISGVLLQLRARDEVAAVERLEAELGPLLERTTSISAALLRAAAEGYAVPEVVSLVALVDLMAEPVDDPDNDPDAAGAARGAPAFLDATWLQAIGPAIEHVLAIGHSSGRDLVAGIVGASHALAEHPPTTTNRVQEGILNG